MKHGVRFQIPNEYGKYLAEILEPIDCTKYNWKVESSTEIWKVTDGKLGDELLSDDLIDGNKFSNLIKSSMYYLIFATLKAFPKGIPIIEIPKYEDFISSDCEISFIVADCSFVCLLCKNVSFAEKLFINAKNKGFEKIIYIDENDNIEEMYNN